MGENMAYTIRFGVVGGHRASVIVFLLVWFGCLRSWSDDLEVRNAYKVKNAFRDAVRAPVRSTVRVLCDSRRVALGTIVDADGYVLTKASELKGETVCQLFDGRRLEADVVGTRDDHDLALLKIRANNLPVIDWSDSEPPSLGSWLATPGLETIPISIGVVSVGPRKIERRVPALGIIIEDSEKGPMIHQVVPESGAAKAGLRRNDVVVNLNGKRVESRDGLIQAIRKFRPGDKVRLRILRAKEELAIEATLGELAQIVHGREYFQNGLGGRLSERRAGFPLALQHDTVLQPNQCGGPVVDLDGKAVGINIARASRVASYALPASVVKPLLGELKSRQMVNATPTD